VPVGLVVAGIAVAVLFMFVFQNFRPIRSHLGGGGRIVPNGGGKLAEMRTAPMPNSYGYNNNGQIEMNEMQKYNNNYSNKQEEADAMTKPQVKRELRF
jgi:hypothetical protein